MKFNINKHSALKGLLLLALIGNMSWRPAMESLNLSSKSDGAEGEVHSGAPQVAAPSTGANPSPPGPGAVTTGAGGTRPDAPAKPTGGSPPPVTETETPSGPRSEVPKICGKLFYITFTEVTVNNETMTEMNVNLHAGVVNSFKPLVIRARGGLDVNVDNETVKKENDGTIKALVRKRLGRCDDDTAVATTPNQKPAPSTSPTKEEKAALALAVKECRKNSKGEILTEIELAHCQIARLSDIDVDTDKRGAAARAMAKIERLVKGDIRKAIKNRLMSKDDSKVDEGEELLTDTLDAIKDLARTHDLDPAKLARLAGGLEALRAGGDTFRRSNALSEDVRESATEFRERIITAQQNLRMNPNDPWAIQQVNQIRRDIMMRENELQTRFQMDVTNGPYSSLIGSMRMGNISSSEFSEFSRPYQMAQRDMLSLLDDRALMSGNFGGSTFNPSLGVLNNPLPSDYLAYRGRINPNYSVNLNPGINPNLNPNFQPGFINNGMNNGRFQQPYMQQNQAFLPQNQSVFNRGLYSNPNVPTRFGNGGRW